MFKFIKNVFSRKPAAEAEPSSAEVKLNELESWFSSKTERKFSQLNYRNNLIFEDVRNSKEKIKEKLEALNNAKLSNPNISTRELQIMEGNKITYMRKVELFANQLGIPETLNFDSSVEFHANFQRYIDDLNKNTQKPFFVLKYFFDNEVESVAREIGGLNQKMEELRKNISENNEINQILEVKKAVRDLAEKNNAIQRIAGLISDEETNRDNIANETEDIELKIEKVQKSDDYVKLEELRKEKMKIENDLTNAKLGISAIFASLEKPFKKFKNIKRDDELLDKYINEPMNAFFEDKEFKILERIIELRGQLDNLDLDEKRKSRAVEVVDGLTNDKLLGLRNKYLELKNSFEANERKIRLNNANTHLTDLDYKLTFLKDKLAKSEERIALLSQKLEKVKDMIQIGPLQEKLKKVTNVDVKVIV